jgi:alkylation response protein AidB-like acyl-CoA dehydrogenase
LVSPADVDADQVEHPLDPLTPVWSVSSLPAGTALAGDTGDAAGWRRDGAVLTAALQAGIAVATTDLAVAYAKQREQFGRPIGAFQAVKHICADMFARAELATVAVEAAAASVDQPGVGDPERAAQVAKLLADEAASANSRACVQVHGGMGFTWEVVAHFYLKRAWVHATQFGSEEETSEALAQSL